MVGVALPGYAIPMTDAAFRAFVARARAEVAAELERLDEVDRSDLAPDELAMLTRYRQDLIALWESMTDDALRAELEATEYAGRDLTPDEVRAIRTRQ